MRIWQRCDTRCPDTPHGTPDRYRSRIGIGEAISAWARTCGCPPHSMQMTPTPPIPRSPTNGLPVSVTPPSVHARCCKCSGLKVAPLVCRMQVAISAASGGTSAVRVQRWLLIGCGDRAFGPHCSPNRWTAGNALAVCHYIWVGRQIDIDAGCPVGDCERVGVSNRKIVAH